MAPVKNRAMVRAIGAGLGALAVVAAQGAGAQAAHSSAEQVSGQWMGAWAASPVALEPSQAGGVPFGVHDLVIRQTVHLHAGGAHMRVVLTNEFGGEPLKLDAVEAFVAGAGGCHPVTFGGATSVTVAPGRFLASDPVDVAVRPEQDVEMMLRVPRQTFKGITGHPDANATSMVADADGALAGVPGDTDDEQEGLRLAPCRPMPGSAGDMPDRMPPQPPTGPRNGAPGRPSALGRAFRPEHDRGFPLRVSTLRTGSWFFVKGVEVPAVYGASALVTFGDSITDGYRSAENWNDRYPDFLARDLEANPRTRGIAVLNQGISGNRVLSDVADPPFGESALHRFRRDVLEQPGVRAVLILEGINDIGHAGEEKAGETTVSAQSLLAALEQMAGQAHAAGLKAYAGTLTPFLGAGYASPQREAMREELNALLLASKAFDGVVDFDKAVRDPQQPSRMLPAFDCGDHLHPNDAGYQAMAGAAREVVGQ